MSRANFFTNLKLLREISLPKFEAMRYGICINAKNGLVSEGELKLLPTLGKMIG
jgi:hypothetical protein